jgi:ketosteroid isomerase-like protein
MPAHDALGDQSYGTAGNVAAQIAVIRAIYDAFERRDIDGVMAHLAEDVRLELPATSRLAERHGPYIGHAGVREYFADLGRTWQELSLHARDIRAAPGAVVVFGYAEGRVDGEAVRRDVLWTWKLRGSLAVSVRANDLSGGS